MRLLSVLEIQKNAGQAYAEQAPEDGRDELRRQHDDQVQNRILKR